MALLDDIKDRALSILPDFCLALAVLVIGFCIINKIARWVNARLQKMPAQKLVTKKDDPKSHPHAPAVSKTSSLEKVTETLDPTLVNFAVSTISFILKLLLLLCVFSMISVDVTTFLCIAGVLGLVVGLAITSSLTNLVGGLMLLLFRPFVEGDLIRVLGFLGKVDKVHMFSTLLKTLDNKTIFIPNGLLIKDSIINYSMHPTIRIDVEIAIDHSADLDLAQKVLLDAAKGVPRILEEKKPVVLMSDLDYLGVELKVRCWTKSKDQIIARFELREALVLALAQAGVPLARYFSADEQMESMAGALAGITTGGGQKVEKGEKQKGL